MSHTNTTTNYGLPQFLSSDKPAWMADINVAFADIDSQMKTNADAASAAQTTANDAVLNGAPGYSNLSTYAVGDVVNYLGRVYKCDIAVTTPEAFDNAKWSYYRLSDASAQLDVIDDEIGSTDISGIGDGTITGAINALNGSLPGKLSGGALGSIPASATKTINFAPSSGGIVIIGGGTNNLQAIYQYNTTSTTLAGRTIGAQGSELYYLPSGLTLPVTNNSGGNTASVSVISLFGNLPTLS